MGSLSRGGASQELLSKSWKLMIKNKTDENQTEFGYIVIRQPLKASFPRYPVGSAISSSGLDNHKIIIGVLKNRVEKKEWMDHL